jgi:1,4-alpha-glucan branching enzyme
MPDPHALTEQDLYLFNEGSHVRLWEKLGSHPCTVDGREGTRFSVWAPNAAHVSVVGDWNGWSRGADALKPVGASGIWETFVPGVGRGAVYKYHLRSRSGGYRVDKADPFAVHAEVAPKTASVVWSLDYEWNDAAWMERRARSRALAEPMSIYELHTGSWRRVAGEGWRSLSYRELAHQLADYVADLGFTHVELLPVMEHPFFGSWGYQTTGFFAPTSRYGTPQDFMYLVDVLHQRGIGVLLDWVPSHFPSDEHGLAYFDGTHLFEHGDPRQGFHPDWNSFIFNYGRHEVRSFLLSSALYWLDVYHADGLRVDAVASMLYLDYSRKPGEWIPNAHGGRENLDAIGFLRRLNEEVYQRVPGAQTIAEESTAWPMVSRPVYAGGLGFGMKWDMGWMHDTLAYVGRDAVHRSFHHDELTFRMLYAWNENFVLPLSHDEVVHQKRSLLGRMPGDDWQKFANLRALYGVMWTQPGKKLLFMGGELAQRGEWNHDGTIEWHLLEHPPHQGVQRWVRDLNALYRAEPALHELDCDPRGFAWIDCHDRAQSTLAWLRRGTSTRDAIVVACNWTPVPRQRFRLGVPYGGFWRECLNSDSAWYGGSDLGNGGGVAAAAIPWHGQPHSIEITLPPLGVVILKGGPEP